MALTANCGLPGAGKTEYTTFIALKHYRRTNRLIKRFLRRMMGREEFINNVYSDYPILLDKKHHIYSRIVHIDDLDNKYRFLDHACICIDEPQLDYDAFDYALFPRAIGMFLQAHRHFNIDKILFSTQHPNRLVMYEKNIMSSYVRIMFALRIPILNFKIIILRKCYELTDYESIATNDKQEKRLKDIHTKIIFMNARRVHNAYNDKYLAPINSKKPYLNKGFYNSLEMTGEQLTNYESRFLNNNVENSINSIKKKGKGKKNEIDFFADTGQQKKRNRNIDERNFFENLEKLQKK